MSKHIVGRTVLDRSFHSANQLRKSQAWNDRCALLDSVERGRGPSRSNLQWKYDTLSSAFSGRSGREWKYWWGPASRALSYPEPSLREMSHQHWARRRADNQHVILSPVPVMTVATSLWKWARNGSRTTSIRYWRFRLPLQPNVVVIIWFWNTFLAHIEPAKAGN